MECVAAVVPTAPRALVVAHLTSHLVPGLHAEPISRCNASAVAWAGAVIDRYDIVLNPVDHAEASAAVLGRYFPSPQNEILARLVARHRGPHATWYGPFVGTKEPPAAFLELNRCDYPVVELANAKLFRLAKGAAANNSIV